MGRYIQIAERSFNPGISDTKNFYGSGQYRIFNSSTTWTVPTGVSSVRVTALGGGGGGGGAWSPQDNSAPDFQVCYDKFWSIGGGGGGGAYTVGVASVTPGCSCCIVVGAGGAGSCQFVSYWQNTTCANCCNCSWQCCCGLNSGLLCASNGSSGGYSCAFGICAGGGAGGCGGRCGWGSLEACVWCVCTNWNTYCNCINCGCSGGGCAAGGTTGNGFVTYCGAPGSPVCWTSLNQCIVTDGRICNNSYGGGAGSPLGHASGTSIPTVFNCCCAFDGSNDTESTLILKYDLPFPRWEGQVIYTQSCGVGRPGAALVCCSAQTTCGCCSCYCCVSMCRWQAAPQSANFCVCSLGCSNDTTIVCGNPFTYACAGLGAGGVATWISNACQSGCVRYCNRYCCWTVSNTIKGGNGQIIVEW